LSPSEDQDSNWHIEHVALLNPTEFSPNNFNSHVNADPSHEAEAQEIIAQEKILQFFNQKQIAPSPWSNPRNRSKPLSRSKGINKIPGDPFLHQAMSKSASTQTSLSFPPILPLEVEEFLQQYMNSDPQDEAGQSPISSNGDCDESSLNASSLRRKLFTQVSTPSTGDTDVSRQDNRDVSSSPILRTGPQTKNRFSFSPCSRPVSPPILSPICSHDDEESSMVEAARQSWGETGFQPSSYPEHTVLMETYDNEAGYFSCSSNVQSRETILVDESNGEPLFLTERAAFNPTPIECSTPTKTGP